MKILFIGDIVGKHGRNTVKHFLPILKTEYSPDLTIANGENSSGGNGLTQETAIELYDLGIDFLTLGNHAWDKKDILSFIDMDEKLVRPANYPPGTPGRGWRLIKKRGFCTAVLNLQGRVFMNPIDCPFRIADQLLQQIHEHTSIVLVDFHAEATSEKVALGHYLDGRVSAIVGTHTHVQTSDERILQNGSAYITDVGMTGPYESVLGIKKETIITRFMTQLPNRFEVASGMMQINGVLVEIDPVSGKAKTITRIARWE